MTISRRILFLVVLSGMVLFLLGMSGYHRYVLWTGQRVVLETQPVDPRSLFRGDYVTLNYTINLVACKKSTIRDSKKYVLLKRKDNTWKAAKLFDHYPQAPLKGTILLRGQLVDLENGHCTMQYPSIQSYFVPEGTGRKIERFQGRGLKVEIAVGPNGYAAIRRLIFPEPSGGSSPRRPPGSG